jgi:hypothetical protein
MFVIVSGAAPEGIVLSAGAGGGYDATCAPDRAARLSRPARSPFSEEAAVSSARTALAAALCALAPALAAEPADVPSPEQIGKWVKQLGDDDFDAREAATQKLWQAGRHAEEALKKALDSDDREVRRRAAELLDKFKWGLYPDTPKEVAELIGRYQNADAGGKLGVVRELLDKGTAGSRVVLKIARAEENADLRRQLFNLMAAEVPRTVPVLLADGDHATLETLLELGLDNDVRTGVAHCAAYWLLRGTLDKRLAEFERAEKKSDNPKRAAEVLAHLYRAKGDRAAALAAARRSGNDDLVEGLLVEGADWKELARRNGSVEWGREVEKLGHRAAYLRLAGNVKDYEAAVSDLRKYAESLTLPAENAALFWAAKALFLNGRHKEGVEALLRGDHKAAVFEIYCAQGRFPDAFALVEAARKANSPELAHLEVLDARVRYALGEKDRARAAFLRLAEQIKDGNDLSWFEDLVESEYRVGLADLAFAHAGRVLSISKDEGWQPRLFGKLFPRQVEAAVALWPALAETDAGADPPTRLKKLRALLEGKLPPKDVEKFVARAREPKQEKERPAEELARLREGLAEAAAAAKLDALAVSLLEQADSTASWQRLGDRAAERKEWEQAARDYRRAWERDRRQALPLFLHGHALRQAGKDKEGGAAVEQSHWLPLGDEALRYEFADALMKRGHTADGKREFELMQVLGEVGGYYAGEALRRLAVEAVGRRDYLTAANANERSTLRVLRTYVNFLNKPAYVGVPALVRRQRAAGLAAAGKVAEALAEADASFEALPAAVEVATLLVPVLEKGGHKKEADALFARCLAVQTKLSRDYPAYAGAHNGVAWLCVACRRDLDEALKHAQKAVELAPEEAGHLDTLAEVYFQLGDKEKAVATQRKVVQMAPQRAYFRKQLRRLEAGDPAAPLLPEDDEDDD